MVVKQTLGLEIESKFSGRVECGVKMAPKKEDYDDDDDDKPIGTKKMMNHKSPTTTTSTKSKSIDNTKKKERRKKEEQQQKQQEEEEQAKKKRQKKVYDLPGQKRDPPEERDPLRIFYETLYKQKPTSELAAVWMMESGLLPLDEATKVYQKKINKSKSPRATVNVTSPAKPVRTPKEKLEATSSAKKKTTAAAAANVSGSASKQLKKKKAKDESEEEEEEESSSDEESEEEFAPTPQKSGKKPKASAK